MLGYEEKAYKTCVFMLTEEIPEPKAREVCEAIIYEAKQRYFDLKSARDSQIAKELAQRIYLKYGDSLSNKLDQEKLTGVILKMANTKTNYEILKEGLNLIGAVVSLVSLIKMA